MKTNKYFEKEWHDSNKKITNWGLAMLRIYILIGFIIGSLTTLLLTFLIMQCIR